MSIPDPDSDSLPKNLLDLPPQALEALMGHLIDDQLDRTVAGGRTTGPHSSPVRSSRAGMTDPEPGATETTVDVKTDMTSAVGAKVANRAMSSGAGSGPIADMNAVRDSTAGEAASEAWDEAWDEIAWNEAVDLVGTRPADDDAWPDMRSDVMTDDLMRDPRVAAPAIDPMREPADAPVRQWPVVAANMPRPTQSPETVSPRPRQGLRAAVRHAIGRLVGRVVDRES